MAGVHEPDLTSPDAQQATDHMSLKERQRQERERLILQMAAELLIEKGYHETSMEEIASRVGISKGAVYLHFASKEELIWALFAHGIRAFVGSLDEVLSGGGIPSEKLSHIIELIYGSMSKRFQLMAAVSQSPDLHRFLAEKRRTLAATWTEPSQRIAALIDEGKRLGEFDPLLPTPLVLSLLWCLLPPHGYQQLVVGDGLPVEEVVGHLRRYFLKGIAAGEPPTMGGEGR
jgi:TetR/AcrR family fatty acid metabolism transcriptional regulator